MIEHLVQYWIWDERKVPGMLAISEAEYVAQWVKQGLKTPYAGFLDVRYDDDYPYDWRVPQLVVMTAPGPRP